VDGFPEGYIEEFKKIPSNKKKKLLEREDSDPIELVIMQLKFPSEAYEEIFRGTVTTETIIFCDGRNDALILFDDLFGKTTVPAPVSSEMMRTQHIHLFGFTQLGEHNWFSSPGEIMSITGTQISISSLTIQGLSGSAIVCDKSGGVLGFSGGAQADKQRTPFGAYVYRIDYVYAELQGKVGQTPQSKKRPAPSTEESGTPPKKAKKEHKKENDDDYTPDQQ